MLVYQRLTTPKSAPKLLLQRAHQSMNIPSTKGLHSHPRMHKVDVKNSQYVSLTCFDARTKPGTTFGLKFDSALFLGAISLYHFVQGVHMGLNVHHVG